MVKSNKSLGIIEWMFFRFADYFVEIYSTTLTLVFLGCTGVICLALLLIQIQISQSQASIPCSFAYRILISSTIQHDHQFWLHFSNFQANNGSYSTLLMATILFGIMAVGLVFACCEASERWSWNYPN